MTAANMAFALAPVAQSIIIYYIHRASAKPYNVTCTFTKPFSGMLFIFLSLAFNGQARQRLLISFGDTSTGNEFKDCKTPKRIVALPAKCEIVATCKFCAFAFVYDHKGWVGISRNYNAHQSLCTREK